MASFVSWLGPRRPERATRQALIGPTQMPMQVLTIEKVYYFIESNTMAHRTDSYAITQRAKNPALIIRRGQAFNMDIKFDKNFFPNLHKGRLIFRHARFAREPYAPGKKYGFVKVNFDISDPVPQKVKDWKVTIVRVPNIRSRYLQLEIVPSADCMIGQWQITFQIKLPDIDFIDADQFDHLHILCNPWCEDDDCYVPTDEDTSDDPQLLTPTEVEDCVINDTGCIFTGIRDQVECRPWHHAQFDEGILEYMYSHLDRMPAQKAGKPIEIAKHLMKGLERLILSDMTNMGQLDQGKYRNIILTFPGTNSLVGRIKELEYENEKLLVSDHVLAALFTSLCRTIGIPSRCVTCYDCMQNIPQHIQYRDVETRYRWGSDGKLMGKEGGNRWAYHVWSEIYCKRSDFQQAGPLSALRDKQYDGWQVIDHSRTENADQPMQSLGPASLFAIKNRRLDDAGDTKHFVRSISEPIHHTILNFGPHGAMFRIINHSRCGSLIVTKECEESRLPVLDDEGDELTPREMARDITELYKKPEGDMVHGLQVFDMMDQAVDSTQEVEFSYYYVAAMVGEDFEFSITVINTSDVAARRVTANLMVFSVNQYGEDRKLLYSTNLWTNYRLNIWDEFVACADSKDIILEWQHYKDALKPGNQFQLVVTGHTDRPQHIILMDDFYLHLPKMKIEVEEDRGLTEEEIKNVVHQLTVGQSKSMTLEFTSPLPVAISDWSLAIEGAGVKPHRVDKPKNFPNVPPQGIFRAEFSITPTRATPGTVGTLIVTFNHQFLGGTFAFRTFTVLPPAKAKFD